MDTTEPLASDWSSAMGFMLYAIHRCSSSSESDVTDGCRGNLAVSICLLVVVEDVGFRKQFSFINKPLQLLRLLSRCTTFLLERTCIVDFASVRVAVLSMLLPLKTDSDDFCFCRPRREFVTPSSKDECGSSKVSVNDKSLPFVSVVAIVSM